MTTPTKGGGGFAASRGPGPPALKGRPAP